MYSNVFHSINSNLFNVIFCVFSFNVNNGLSYLNRDSMPFNRNRNSLTEHLFVIEINLVHPFYVISYI